jgi:hypothetical protein
MLSKISLKPGKTRKAASQPLRTGEIARRSEAVEPKRTFTSGLLLGLSAAGHFLAGDLPAPRAPVAGQESDWKAVGQDISKALRDYGTKRRA